MRLSVMVVGLVCLCAVGIGIAAPAFQDGDDVRGAFMTSRPKDKPVNSGGTSTRTSRRRPKPNNPPDKTTGKAGPSKPTPTPSESSTPVNAQRLGLGVTLFMRDSNGLAVRVDPDHVFRKGDRVRVLLETNTDGYLYIFNTTDDGPPTMIYPDASLDEAGNYLQAHVTFEIPTSLASEERLRWFAFDETAGTEHLYFVFTREPLKDIPIEDDLIAFCCDSQCPVQPNAQVWAAVQKEAREPFKTDKTPQFGKAETSSEEQAAKIGR